MFQEHVAATFRRKKITCAHIRKCSVRSCTVPSCVLVLFMGRFAATCPATSSCVCAFCDFLSSACRVSTPLYILFHVVAAYKVYCHNSLCFILVHENRMFGMARAMVFVMLLHAIGENCIRGEAHFNIAAIFNLIQ